MPIIKHLDHDNYKDMRGVGKINITSYWIVEIPFFRIREL